MFATCPATKVSMANNARPKDSKKNGNFQKKKKKKKKKKKNTKKKKKKKKKNDFYPKISFFSQYRKNSLFNGNNTLSHTKSSKLNLASSKRHIDMLEKEACWTVFLTERIPHTCEKISRICHAAWRIRLNFSQLPNVFLTHLWQTRSVSVLYIARKRICHLSKKPSKKCLFSCTDFSQTYLSQLMI